MGRISILLAAASVLALGSADASEIRQVAPGITMAPGTAKPAQAKKSEPPKVETSKSEPTTYGARVSPEPPVEAKVEPPKPSQPPVAVNAEPKPDPNLVSRPVAASPAATPQPSPAAQPAATAAAQPAPATQPAPSQQKVVTAPKEQLREPQQNRPREIKVGDRIPDDVQLYDGPPRRQAAERAPIRVGDRVPDDVPLYGSRREALR